MDHHFTPFRQLLKENWFIASDMVAQWKEETVNQSNFIARCEQEGIKHRAAYYLLKLNTLYRHVLQTDPPSDIPWRTLAKHMRRIREDNAEEIYEELRHGK